MVPHFRRLLWVLMMGFTQGQQLEGDSMKHDGRSFCTMDELLPGEGSSISLGQSAGFVDTPPYDCTCTMTKARYFCPHLGDRRYPMWQPSAVLKEDCFVVDRDKLAKAPLPPMARVLVYGNSHLRQVVQGTMCMFSDALLNRMVNAVEENSNSWHDHIVGPDVQCRACGAGNSELAQIMVNNSCFAPEIAREACRCSDDTGVFNFNNGATLHYYFAHVQKNKHVEDALRVFKTDFSDYDMIFVNHGNTPNIEARSLLDSAKVIQKAGVPLIWTSTYDGHGTLRQYFGPEGVASFHDLGARYFPAHEIVKAAKSFVKGKVEGGEDGHFCLPGPPNEIGIFLLQLVWSHWIQTS